MTAHGSEEIAVTALKRGAASYVPKTALNHDLVPTVFNVLAVSRGELTYERMMAGLQESQWNFTLGNDYRLIAPLVQLTRRTMTEMGVDDDAGRIQVSVALEEALLTAIYQGNLELTPQQLASAGYDLQDSEARNLVEQRRSQSPYRDRSIQLNISLLRSEIRCMIRCEGPGFDPGPPPQPSDVLARAGQGHRGRVHMRLFMDEVAYDIESQRIVLVKRFGQAGCGG